MRRILTIASILMLCSTAVMGQDIIYPLRGEPVECVIDTVNINSGNLFYLLSNGTEEITKYMPIDKIHYITLASSGKNYFFRRYSRQEIARRPEIYKKSDIEDSEITVLRFYYKIMEMSPGTSIEIPRYFHRLSVEAGIQTPNFFSTANFKAKASYVYYPWEHIGVGVMANWSQTLNNRMIEKKSYQSIKEGNTWYAEGNHLYAGAVVSFKTYLTNMNSFIFADLSAGYNNIQLCSIKYDQGDASKEVVSSLGTWAVNLALGGETSVKRDSPLFICYSVGMTYANMSNPATRTKLGQFRWGADVGIRFYF